MGLDLVCGALCGRWVLGVAGAHIWQVSGWGSQRPWPGRHADRATLNALVDAQVDKGRRREDQEPWTGRVEETEGGPRGGETETAQKTPPACLQTWSQVQPPGLWGGPAHPPPATGDECSEVRAAQSQRRSPAVGALACRALCSVGLKGAVGMAGSAWSASWRKRDTIRSLEGGWDKREGCRGEEGGGPAVDQTLSVTNPSSRSSTSEKAQGLGPGHALHGMGGRPRLPG